MADVEWHWNNLKLGDEPCDGAVCVWSFDLDAPAGSVGFLCSLLSKDEHERASRYATDELRHRFVVGRATLRQVLGRLLGATPETIALEYTQRGKPELCGPYRGMLHFNLSHSRNVALIAVTRVGPVGVDVEHVREVWDPHLIASRFFTPMERDALAAMPESDRVVAFFDLWTRKEAWLKATGQGIAESLDLVEFSFKPGAPPKISKRADASGPADVWSVMDLSPARGYVGALVVNSPNLNVRCAHLVL